MTVPVPIPAKKKEYSKNVFKRMETDEGPLKLLKQCIDTNKKIKVKYVQEHSH